MSIKINKIKIIKNNNKRNSDDNFDTQIVDSIFILFEGVILIRHSVLIAEF